uniref:Palmitoyltransferase n=1 Tax=Panagrellus redivivus TaxID=6233 RepID=A0A7E4ZSJ8_PANRE
MCWSLLDVVKGCCNRCPWRGVLFTILYWLDIFFRKGLGKFLSVVVYGLVLFVVATLFVVIFPYESWWIPLPTLLIPILYIITVYFTFSILWHYRQASITSSGKPVKSSQEPQCWKCKNHKSSSTHHCSICGECVVLMDHHCIWINRCVGAGNHRYFLQFCAFLTIGSGLACVISSSTFYYNYWRPSHDVVICNVGLKIFWMKQLCSYGNDAIGGAIFFTYSLCLIISLLVGALFWWNVLLISNGQTYIRFLKRLPSTAPDNSWKAFLTPWRRPDICEVWSDFLGLTNGRTFIRHILLPSKHKPIIPLHWDDEPPTVRLLTV